MHFSPNDVIAERYKLQQRLGINGGRETWLVKDLEQDQDWVLKLLFFGDDTRWQELKLMDREVETLQSLDHPGIPRFEKAFWTEQAKGHYFCLLQQYIPGTTLSQQIKEGGRYNEQHLEYLIRSLLDILQYLHQQSPPVVHRDIKPSNILVGDDGKIYLIDFGAVQARATGGSTITVVGTFGYMPPEQFSGQSVPASDLYALGVVLIHLATGLDPCELPRKGLRFQFEERLQLDAGWCQWLINLVEPELEKRFKNANEAIQAFERRGILPESAVVTVAAQPRVSMGLEGWVVSGVLISNGLGIVFILGGVLSVPFFAIPVIGPVMGPVSLIALCCGFGWWTNWFRYKMLE